MNINDLLNLRIYLDNIELPLPLQQHLFKQTQLDYMQMVGNGTLVYRHFITPMSAKMD